MLNYDMQIFKNLTVDDLNSFGNKPIHIRPVEDTKAFTGIATTVSEFTSLVENIKCEVAISSVKNILAEYRFFIVGGTVISGSSYMVDGFPNTKGVVSDKIYTFTQEVADIWLPHENVVMDIADTNDGFKIIELNCFNCSGIYSNDMVAVFQALIRKYN
jgi:hypothetical protein